MQHEHGRIQLSSPCLSRTLSAKGERCTLFSFLLKEVVGSLIHVLFLVAMDLPANNYYTFSLHPFHPSKETRHFVTKDQVLLAPKENEQNPANDPCSSADKEGPAGTAADTSSLQGPHGPAQGLVVTTGRGQAPFSSIFLGPCIL